MEKILNKIMNEDNVVAVSEKILSRVRDKLKEQVCDAFYNELECFLYEHYTNCRDEIENEMIKDITEQFIQDPQKYKYRELRDKIFKENKEEIIKSLQDDAIQSNVENVIMEYTGKGYSYEEYRQIF